MYWNNSRFAGVRYRVSQEKNDNNLYLPEEIIELNRLKTIELTALVFPNKNTSVSINNIFASTQVKAFLTNLLKYK